MAKRCQRHIVSNPAAPAKVFPALTLKQKLVRALESVNFFRVAGTGEPQWQPSGSSNREFLF
jgi:hypothetical protein